MRCHYEVFELPRESSEEEIKKQYKRLALKWHPDKNVGNEEEATARFKEISSAYAVLSDPHERRWYDDHRDSILRGDGGVSGEDDRGDSVDLWKYFSSNCYNGPDDGKTGFFTVYSSVFEQIHRAEETSGDSAGWVPFGNSGAERRQVLEFYIYWEAFATRLSFSWADKYNPQGAPNRDVRRAIEKENKKVREHEKKTYVDTVKALVQFIKKRDKRILGESKLHINNPPLIHPLSLARTHIHTYHINLRTQTPQPSGSEKKQRKKRKKKKLSRSV